MSAPEPASLHPPSEMFDASTSQRGGLWGACAPRRADGGFSLPVRRYVHIGPPPPQVKEA